MKLPAIAAPSLSRKIILGYHAIALLIAGAAAFTFHELAAIEDKTLLGEKTTELLETTLEIRRFERNFFLHRQSHDQIENHRAVVRARACLDENHIGFSEIGKPASIARFRELLMLYEQRMMVYAAMASRSGALDAVEMEVRAAGKEMVAIAGDIANSQTAVVRTALMSFRRLLVMGIAAVAILIVILSRTISRRIVLPLKTMEKNVEDVSRRKSGTLEAPTRDREITSITNAFNHMLHELEMRQNHLLRSEKLASLGTMLSGVAHELNNPLSNISTSCQIALEELNETDPSARKIYLDQIDEQCNRARNIVRSLLEFARHRDFRRVSVPLQPLISQTLSFLRSELPAGIKAQSNIPESVAVAGDPQRLQQALLNLIKNAAEAQTGKGSVTISAQARHIHGDSERGKALFAGCPLEGEVVDIAIADTGPGIPADVLPRIFDPFYTTKDVGRGMGLGLFITHEVIEEHDGCIAVTTGTGGTTFHIRLPAAAMISEPEAITTSGTP